MTAYTHNHLRINRFIASVLIAQNTATEPQAHRLVKKVRTAILKIKEKNKIKYAEELAALRDLKQFIIQKYKHQDI